MSALPPIAGIRQLDCDVPFVPKVDIPTVAEGVAIPSSAATAKLTKADSRSCGIISANVTA
jgi:hypothetical protein